ncbi:MAG TPA: hypothetical protein VHN11_16545 [Xanthobacteraceae bacterium]|nr:hypothetical protein [Xanthobacteraceae bacterium]
MTEFTNHWVAAGLTEAEVVEVTAFFQRTQERSRRQNALIAAAPQLLEAAEAVIDYEREAMVECTPDCGCAFCMLRAAVAAAKGEN